ncbi:cytochrome P450 [Rhodofomes roseus]|uniref:Cytochrome P450 n=1 Tax=Rhodofomes roseus TaxID=34475 RepID=A0ABQ8JYD5_9APHY|nr:cytochrome P450 [Rhodofomes roseus]KAH9829289.1 cytochrome P450 [Rhodofomes roseus]
MRRDERGRPSSGVTLLDDDGLYLVAREPLAALPSNTRHASSDGLNAMADSANALVAALAPIQDGLLADAGLALHTHVWFKRYEPTDLVSLGILLGVLPAVPVALLRVPLASTPLAILVGNASFYAFLFFSITAYRLSPFHSLYKLTNFRGMFIAAGGKQHLYFKEMHAKYGPIVRLGPNVLSIVDTDLLPSILNMPRGPMWDGRRISGKRGQGTAGIQKGNLMGSRNMQVHGEARKVWNRTFTTASVKKYEPIVIRRVSQLVDELKGRCAANPSKAVGVDIAYWIDCFSFDFMGDFAVPNLSGYVPRTIEAVVWLPFLPKGAKNLGEFAFQQVLRRLKEGAVHDDLFYHLNAEAKIDNDPPPLPVLVSNAVTAIVAGSDTTAVSLTHALYLLMGHPTCYKRLQAELDAVFPHWHRVIGGDLFGFGC